MKYEKFIDLDKVIDGLFEQEKYTEALKEFEEGLKDLPEKEIQEHYFMIQWVKTVLYTTCEKYEDCFPVIEEVINKGYAFPLHFKRIEPLREKEKFPELEQKNNKLLEALRKDAKSEFVVHLPKGYNPSEKYPLFLALHGDGMCNIKGFSQMWKPDVFLENNFIIAYMQSSQAVCYDGYAWLSSSKKAIEDIKNNYAAIVNEYSVDEGAVYVGGFSGGAITSINLTMSHELPIKGFIGLCPEIKPEFFTRENVELAARKGVKGVIMEGELVLPMKEEEEMIEMFDEVGLPYDYYINKGIGHSAPEDFDDKLNRALQFITQ